MKNTSILFLSDHGFYFGEHGKIGKHTIRDDPWALYEEIAHIPLIVYHPHVAHKRIDLLVQPQDIMTTILEICNIRIPDTVQGKSLFGALSGGQTTIRKAAVSTGALHKELPSVETRILVTDGEWSFIFGSQEENELYDLRIDSKQENNLYSKNQNVADTLYRNIIASFKSIRCPGEVIDKIDTYYIQGR